MTIKEIYTKYKKYIKWIVYAVVFFLVMSWLFKSCDLKDGYSVLAGEYKAQLAAKKIEEKAKLKEIALLTKDAEAKDKKIVVLEADVAKKQASLTTLAGDKVALVAALSIAKTDGERVIILTQTVNNLDLQLSLSAGIISDQGKEIVLLKDKVDNFNKIANDYKALWEGAVQREETLNDMNSKLSGQLRIARLGGKVKTIVAVAAIGVVGYNLLKKG